MSPTRFYTPQEAEAAFYAAFAKQDLAAMMAVWADDPQIACILPLGPKLIGPEAVRAGWETIFHHSPQMQLLIEEQGRAQDGALAVHTVQEHIRIGGETSQAPVLVTNIYRLTDGGWRMILHHASPAPQPRKQRKKTLH